MIEQQFLKQCKEKAYFIEHQRVLLAISGGLDSMTLLNLLYKYQKELDIELILAHINHKQRIEADQEEKQLKEIAQKLGVKILTSSFSGVFSEKSARDFRYNFFKKVMQEEDCTALVTAHHADDQAETIFMRILRGSRLRYLSGMKDRQPFGGGELIRPLLEFSKTDFPTVFHFEDASNFENTYFRNRVRNQYFPLLETENPRIKQAIIGLGLEIAQLQKALSGLTKDLNMTDLQTFRKQKREVQVFLLQEYLEKFPDLQLSKAQFDDILHIVNTKTNYHHYLKNQYELIQDYQAFKIQKIGPKSDSKKGAILLQFEDIIELGGYCFSFGKELVGEVVQMIPVSRKTSIVLRHRQSGDRILLNGHHKKLARYFIDKKYSLKERDEAVIVEQFNEILGIAGIVTGDLSKNSKRDIMKDVLYIKKIDR